jgi:hypothetical protein
LKFGEDRIHQILIKFTEFINLLFPCIL